ncbi:MAG TPA: glycosyltransferase family 39 protein [Oligoflexia bacterium]|nr:glycosyltransferase family 39 protein [Oligoflexia bacterium]HMP49725.1 glycosyltransferase family 39 protein [Oligoflexia bacterium]
MNSSSFVALFFILFILIASRFTALDKYPPGFYVDEALCAAHTLCLNKYGTNCDGESWPFYSKSWGNGRVGPVYQYLGLIWTKLFGGSIFSFRAMSSLAGILAATLSGMIVSTILNRSAGFWVFFAALLSPWGFHSSRLAWDPALSPMILLLSVLLLLKSRKSKNWFWYCILSGLSVVVTFHTYSPVGIQAVFLFSLLFLFQKFIQPLAFKKWFVFGLSTVIIFSTSLFFDTSQVRGRANEVSIFGEDKRNPDAGKSMPARIPQFLDNISKHYSFDYLITNGDKNLRHTSNSFGILSWVDIYSLLMGLILIIGGRNQSFNKMQNLTKHEDWRGVFLLGALGYLSSAVAASLTWDSLPHALRSIGGWPFIALASGASLFRISHIAPAKIATKCIAVLFIYYYGTHYTGQFVKDSAMWFDKDVTDTLKQSLAYNNHEYFNTYMTNRYYHHEAKRYFDLQFFNIEVVDKKRSE